jgi:hypothetical protein
MVDEKRELLKEWHPSRNMELKASEVSLNQREKMWWICSQGHEWEATIRARLRGKACPFCSNRLPQLSPAGGQGMSATPRKTDDLQPGFGKAPFAAFPEGLAAPHGGTDLRRSMRYERAETVMVEKLRSEILGYAQLKNFSADGMMLLSDYSIHPGEFIKLRFDRPLHASIPDVVPSRVVWCQDFQDKDEDGFRFGIGLRLM